MVKSFRKILYLFVFTLTLQALIGSMSARVTTRGGKRQKTSLVCRMVSVDVHRNNQSSAAVSYFNVTYRHEGAAVVADGFMHIQRSAKYLSLLTIKITRCPEAVSYNTCEYFDTWKYRVGVCGLLQAKNMPWTPWIEAYRPAFRCPFLAGSYSFKGATIDGSTVSHLPIKLENAFWIIEYDIFDEDSKAFVSMDTTFEFKRVRL